MCFAGEGTYHLDDHTLGETDGDSAADPCLPAMSDTGKRCHGQPPSAPEGNRTPGLQFEKLASLANGDSGSAVKQNQEPSYNGHAWVTAGV